jgi:REP element-mobilizing transposase RayT
MANTFSQISAILFAVQGRHSLIKKRYKEELHKYITSLVQARKSKMLAVHCMPDHTHVFVGLKPSLLSSDFVKEIKIQSNEFITHYHYFFFFYFAATAVLELSAACA